MKTISHTPAEIVAALMTGGRYIERSLFCTQAGTSIFDTAGDDYSNDTSFADRDLRDFTHAGQLRKLASRGLDNLHLVAWIRVDESLAQYAVGDHEDDNNFWMDFVEGQADPAADALLDACVRFEEDEAFRDEVLDLLFVEYEAERGEYAPSNEILSISVEVGPSPANDDSDESLMNEYVPRLQAAIEDAYPDVNVTVSFVRNAPMLKVEFVTEDDESSDEKLDEKETIEQIAADVLSAGWDD